MGCEFKGGRGYGPGAGLAEESDDDDPGPDVGTTVGGLGGYQAEDYGSIFNKGGLAQQMKQSGLASKK